MEKQQRVLFLLLSYISGNNFKCFCKFYAVRTVNFGMKLYNGQRNAQVFNLFIYLLLPYMFRAFF
jgi:hypothetical protein